MAFSHIQSLAFIWNCPTYFYYVTLRPGMPEPGAGDDWDAHYTAQNIPALAATAQHIRDYNAHVVRMEGVDDHAACLSFCALLETLLPLDTWQPEDTLRSVLAQRSPETLTGLEEDIAQWERNNPAAAQWERNRP